MLFYATQAALEPGGTVDAGWRRAYGTRFWDGLTWQTLQLNWPFWAAVHSLTYTVVPLRFRVAFVSTVAIFWNGVLSSLNEARRRGPAGTGCGAPGTPGAALAPALIHRTAHREPLEAVARLPPAA